MTPKRNERGGSNRRRKLSRQADFSSTRRAMREMGFDPGNQLDVPSQSFLDEKGMAQDEFMDAVFERARELKVSPVRSLGAGRIDSGQPRPQMRGEGERTMSREAEGGQGASATEDLLERLSDYKRSAYGNKYEKKYNKGGRFPSNHLGERMYGQEASRVRKSPDGRTFVWYAGDADGLHAKASDQEWEDIGAVKVYGDFSKYSNSLSDFIRDDHDYIIRPAGDGTYEIDEDQTQAQAGHEKAFNMAEEVQYDDKGTTKGLLEKLSDYKRNAYGNKYEQGGEVKGKSTIKIAGQYAVEPVKTTPEGKQYVSMEMPDGEIATVFGDWETYGNPNRDGLIEDLDYRIYPLGDGTYALDAAEAEADMLREEARQFSQGAQGGQGASATEDLLEKLSDRRGMGMTPDGRMRPIKRN